MLKDRIQFFAKHPSVALADASMLGLTDRIDDRRYLRLMFRLAFRQRLHLDPPKTYSEKLQWIKLNDRKPIYSRMVDKVDAKKYIAECIGEGHTLATLGVWDSFDEIDFDALSDQFVLKTSHDSGGAMLCRNKADFDYEAARRFYSKHLAVNYYTAYREWPYRNVKPRILAEELLPTDDGSVLTDYKFFCFNGEPKMMYITKEEDKTSPIDFFDMDFKPLPLSMDYFPSVILPEKPALFEQMRDAARAIASRNHTYHLRVDFYCSRGNFYVGEMTFFHGAGFQRITPESWEDTLGEWIRLPMDCT